MPQKRKSGNYQLCVELYPELYDALGLKAALHRRSVSQEVRVALADYCHPPSRQPDASQEKS